MLNRSFLSLRFVIAVLGASSSGTWKAAATETAPEVTFRPGHFTSSAVCGECHLDIYEVWRRRSAHARAATRPAFRSALARVSSERRSACLMCHGPTSVVTGDEGLDLPLTLEGVTCDFCHSLRGIDLGAPVPFDLDVGEVKRGPLRNLSSAPHKSAYSELHTSSLFCAGCHEYRNEHGVQVLSAFSEWKTGPYPGRDVSCQSCHMEVYRAQLVAGQETDDVSRIFINLHEVPGGRFVEQLRRALDVEIAEASRAPEGTTVVVRVANPGAGHRVPGGPANWSIRLEVTMASAGGAERGERVYQRVMVDGAGRAIQGIARLFWDARAVQSDTRLEPEEVREERFEFVSGGKGSEVEVRLIYRVAPAWPGGVEREIEIWRFKEAVR